MKTLDIINDWYHPGAQVGPGQVLAIASALAAAKPANFLVFGCGNDSSMWHHVNSEGRTLFLENDEKWSRKIRERFPYLEIEMVSYEGRILEDSLPIVEDDLAAFDVPECIRTCEWDAIFIDSPRGYKPRTPGRSLPIYWSSQVATEKTQIFIDDYERDVEKQYADHFFRSKRPFNVEVYRRGRPGKAPKGQVMLWSMATPPRPVSEER